MRKMIMHYAQKWLLEAATHELTMKSSFMKTIFLLPILSLVSSIIIVRKAQ